MPRYHLLGHNNSNILTSPLASQRLGLESCRHSTNTSSNQTLFYSWQAARSATYK